MRSVLEALIAVQENFFRAIFFLYGLLERVCYQCDIVRSAYPMSNDEPIKKILDRG